MIQSPEERVERGHRWKIVRADGQGEGGGFVGFCFEGVAWLGQ